MSFEHISVVMNRVIEKAAKAYEERERKEEKARMLAKREKLAGEVLGKPDISRTAPKSTCLHTEGG